MTDTYSSEALNGLATDICLSLGASPRVASTVATSLISANLRGHGTHGVMRLPNYAESVYADELDPSAEPTVTDLGSNAAQVDGNQAFGQYVGRASTPNSSLGLRMASQL